MGWFKKDSGSNSGSKPDSKRGGGTSSFKSGSSGNNRSAAAAAVSSTSASALKEKSTSAADQQQQQQPPIATLSSLSSNRAVGTAPVHSYGGSNDSTQPVTAAAAAAQQQQQQQQSAALHLSSSNKQRQTTHESDIDEEAEEEQQHQNQHRQSQQHHNNNSNNIYPNMSEVEAGKSYSAEYDQYDAEDGPGGNGGATSDSVRQNHLNSLFNGHLMKWKFEAEEGSPFIRIPAFCGALGLIVTSVMALVMEQDAWTTHSIVMSVCILIMATFILILDGRFLATNPLSARAHLRNIMTRNFNIFRFLWGRGLLYVAAGILSVAQMWIVNVYSGAYMIAVGVISLIVGVHASRKFAALRNSLADESFLLLVFSNYDTDGDGYVNPSEFAVLLSDLGMELDDRYTLKAFNVIDTDNDRRISFEEFSHWWASGYIERGRKRRDDDGDDDEVYRRMN
jgi:EF-hand domain pair